MHGSDASAYLDQLYSYAMVLTLNPAEAEALVEETHLRTLHAMGSAPPDSNVKSRVFTLLRNTWLNRLPRQRVSAEMTESDTDDDSANVGLEVAEPAEALGANKLRFSQLREAIEQLPVEFREIILLREYEEMSYQEIASILGCSTGAVISGLTSARFQLRTLLSGTGRPAIPQGSGATPSVPCPKHLAEDDPGWSPGV
jgi:RNA polymerase sigma-70 factor (ECF subfamily)